MTEQAKDSVYGLADRELWEAYWKNPDGGQALSDLMETQLPLVYSVLERVSITLPPHVAIEDLLQAAALGLYHALTRFDPERGYKFSSFAFPRIRGAILDELRQMDYLSRSTRSQIRKVETAIRDYTQEHGESPDENDIAESLGLRPEYVSTLIARSQPWLSLDKVMMSSDGGEMTLRDILADSSSIPPDEEAERNDLRQSLREAFLLLTAKEQKILYLYYYEELRLSEIAQLYELTEARICQIHALSVAKLKAALTKDDV
ncbi:MAG: FliA/WhiG family RNA polymerase sigma factor [Kiritimatiellae bacterium]|nr:FliA/WhiG family RNA polymerase sigma factor [Kiritimatiellia bacterium]MDD4736530.1 FliA/WhiG family RNA polymerase sigma factor [Kiritimatiellia bacterium]